MNKEQKKNVQYDAYAKYILSQKEVLARILKFTIAEFQDLEGEVIMELIEGEPLVSKVSTEPGETKLLGTIQKIQNWERERYFSM